MGRPLRFVPENTLVEVTVRTLQGRYLFKPSPGWREIFIGLLARSQERHPLKIHAFACLSNHFHLLVTPKDAYQLAAFMRYFNTNLSKEAGRLHNWRGILIERRYRSILVSEEPEVQVARLRYVLAHGIKEGLVAKVDAWPGPHCASSLVSGMPAKGLWIDRSRQFAANRRVSETDSDDHSVLYELTLDPLPCWRHYKPVDYCRRVAELLLDLETKARRELRRKGNRPLGIRQILKQHPHHRPRTISWSPAGLAHAGTSKAHLELRRAYSMFVAAYYGAVEKLQRGDLSARFPEGSFPPLRLPIRAGPLYGSR